MTRKDSIPEADKSFNDWQNTWFNGTRTNATNWHIDQMEVESIQPLQTQWVEKYALTLDPATHTTPAVNAKNNARKVYEGAIRKFINEFETYNRYITDDQRLAIGLPVHKTTHTPVPVPSTIPEFTVDTSVIRDLTIHFQDKDSKSKAKPFGVHGAEILWAILPAAPTRIAELLRSGFDTNSPFTLKFDEEDRGKTVYFALRWENTRGEKGELSAINSAIVP
jgi:hypothetical protein